MNLVHQTLDGLGRRPNSLREWIFFRIKSAGGLLRGNGYFLVVAKIDGAILRARELAVRPAGFVGLGQGYAFNAGTTGENRQEEQK